MESGPNSRRIAMGQRHGRTGTRALEDGRHLIAYRLNNSRHQAIIDVSSYPGDTEVPSFCAPDQMRQVRSSQRVDDCAQPSVFDSAIFIVGLLTGGG
jgi:hypothetical protein